jgi:hypothetical protein
MFKMLAGVTGSKGYKVTDTEVRELRNAMSRHDGLFYLAVGSGFVADHKAQGDRLDFNRLFNAYRGEFPFLVGGSDEDPFEHRQVALPKNGWASSVSGWSGCPAVTSPRMSSRKLSRT